VGYRRLALFGTDEDLHRIHPSDFDNTAANVQAESEVLHSLGHQFRYVTLRWFDYLAWLQEHQLPDQPNYQLQRQRSMVPDPVLLTGRLDALEIKATEATGKCPTKRHRKPLFLMRYLLAILLPPLAVLLCGKPFQAVLNCLLTLCFWIPGMIHALMVVSSHEADLRNQELIRAMQKAGR